MFERYDEKARRVIFYARYEASQFGSPGIEPEHILLGISREDKELLARLLHMPEPEAFLRAKIERRSGRVLFGNRPAQLKQAVLTLSHRRRRCRT